MSLIPTVHAANFVMIMVDLFLNRIKFIFSHVLFLLALVCVYMSFQLVWPGTRSV
jgi:hypothetical protein